MIQKCLELLITNNFYNVSENVEIAKGKYEIVTSWLIAKDKIKRVWHTKKK